MINLEAKIEESSSGIYELVIGITSRCNFNCKFCYSSSGRNSIKELPLTKIKEIFDEAKSLGIQIIAISGGEPFLHPDFYEILSYAKKAASIVMLSTNGSFIDKDAAKKLKDLGIDNVQLSIEGPEDINDSLRGVEGAYKKTITALKNLKDNDIDVTLTPTIQEENYQNIFFVWELAKKYNADLSIKRMVETGRADNLSNISPEKYKELYDFAIKENKRRKDRKSRIFIHCDPLRVLYKNPEEIDFTRFTGCIAGKALLYIKYDGDIYPCSKLPIKCGNIYANSLKDVLEKSSVIKEVTNRDKLKGKCGICDYKLVCGGCRASAYGKYQDINEEDPMCWKESDSEPSLFYLTWNSTNLCNLKCKHCYANAGINSDKELSTKEAKEMIKDAKSLGLKYMLFTGGEPLLRKDIFELMKFSKSLGIKNFLATNGTLLKEDHLQLIKDSVEKVNISVDYPSASLHDSFRGVSGAFDKTEKAINLLISNNIPLSISITVCNENIDYLEEMIAFCKTRKLPLNIKRLINVGRSKNSSIYFAEEEYSKLKAILSKNKYKKVLYKDPIYTCEIGSFSGKSLAGCLAGINILSVTSTGDITICTKIPYNFGNIRKDSLIEIWRGNEVLEKIRERHFNGKCSNCKNISICGGCRAAAYNEYGDILAEDPLCKYLDI